MRPITEWDNFSILKVLERFGVQGYEYKDTGFKVLTKTKSGESIDTFAIVDALIEIGYEFGPFQPRNGYVEFDLLKRLPRKKKTTFQEMSPHRREDELD